MDCFVHEDLDEDDQELFMSMKYELRLFRCHVYDSNQRNFEWLKKIHEIYPNVVTLAKHVLRIPPTQMGNDRKFSLAGRLCSSLCNRLKKEKLINLFAIAKNYPFIYDSNKVKWSTIEAFSDYIVENESEEHTKDDESIEHWLSLL